MTYKLNPSLAKIVSLVVLVMDGNETQYPNGAALAECEFEKNYLVESISARDSAVVVALKENTTVNQINWVGEEAVSFF